MAGKMSVYTTVVLLGLIAAVNTAALSKRFDDIIRCDLDYYEKSECGYLEISENECLSNGCCYQETHLANVPWCYRAYGDETTEPPTFPYEIHSTFDPFEEHLGLSPEELSAYDMAWVPDSGGDVPDHAVYIADDLGQRYFIIRVEYDGMIYPGKLGSSHTEAHFAVSGEGELKSNRYEVLQQLPTSPLRLVWITPKWGDPEPWVPFHIMQNYAIVGGEAPSEYYGTYGPETQHLIVVIGETAEGYHPGYVGTMDRHATIPWGGSALQIKNDPDTIPKYAILLAIPEDILPSIKPPNPDFMQEAQVQP